MNKKITVSLLLFMSASYSMHSAQPLDVPKEIAAINKLPQPRYTHQLSDLASLIEHQEELYALLTSHGITYKQRRFILGVISQDAQHPLKDLASFFGKKHEGERFNPEALFLTTCLHTNQAAFQFLEGQSGTTPSIVEIWDANWQKTEISFDELTTAHVKKPELTVILKLQKLTE